MNIKICDFTQKDEDFFITSAKAFYSSPAVDHEVPIENFKKTFEICLNGNPFTRGIIFWVDEKPAGYALLSFTYSNEVAGLTVLLEEVYILPEYQGQGIASYFFKEIEEKYVKLGNAKRLRLEVTASNINAAKLYERLGFEKLEYIQMIKDF